MPSIQSAAPRLGLEIAGLSAGDLSADLVSVRFFDSLLRKGVIEATLTDGASLKYSQGSVLQVGTRVTLTCGDTALATGTIAAVRSRYDAGAGPTMGFTATVGRATSRPTDSVHLTWGADLLEFNVVQQASKPPRRTVAASGVAQGLPTLRAGVALSVSGLGTRWSGDYAVAEATHTFDGQSGYRVSFVGTR